MKASGSLLAIALLMPFSWAAASPKISLSPECQPKLVAAMHFLGDYVTYGGAYLKPDNQKTGVVAFLKYLHPYPLSSNGEVPPVAVYELTFTGSSHHVSNAIYEGHGYDVKQINRGSQLVFVKSDLSKKIESIKSHLPSEKAVTRGAVFHQATKPILMHSSSRFGYTASIYQTLGNIVSSRVILKISNASCRWRKTFDRSGFMDAGFIELHRKEYFTIIVDAHSSGIFPLFFTFELPQR